MRFKSIYAFFEYIWYVITLRSSKHSLAQSNTSCFANVTPSPTHSLFKILWQECCDSLKLMVFRLYQCETQQVIVKTAQEIVLDKYLINHLSQEDVCCISFVAGYEQGMQVAKQVMEANQASQQAEPDA